MGYPIAKHILFLGGCLLLLGCKRSDQADLTKAREEARIAKAEAVAIQAQLAEAQAKLARVRPEAATRNDRKGQDLEVTDTKGRVWRVRGAFLKYTLEADYIGDPRSSEEYDAIQVAIGGAHLKLLWKEVHAVLLNHQWGWDSSAQVVLKTGEVRQCRLEPASLVGSTEDGTEITFNAESSYVRKIINLDQPPGAAALRAVAELDATIDKFETNLSKGGVARFPDGKEMRIASFGGVSFVLSDGSKRGFDQDRINRITFSGVPATTAQVSTTDGSDHTVEFREVSFSVEWADGSRKDFGLTDISDGLTFAADTREASSGR